MAKGVFWSLAGSAISRGLMLCAMVLVARMLGTTVYGELGMIHTTVGMLGAFAGFGLGLTATKHVAQFRRSDPERTGRIIGLSGLFAMGTGGLIALGLFIFAPWLAEHTINAPHLAGVLRISALIVFINALNGAQTGALAGFEAFKTIARVNLLVGLTSFPFLVIGAYLGGLTGAVWALALNLGFNWLFNHIALRQEAHRSNVPLKFQNCRQEVPILWAFSLPATLSGIIVGPVLWVCYAFLANTPNGYAQLGFFTAAMVFQKAVWFVATNLNNPLLAIVCNRTFDPEGKLARLNILSTWSLGLVLAVPLLTFPMIPEYVFGSEFKAEDFRITFAIVMAYTCVRLYKDALSRVLVAKSLLWLSVLSNTVWGAIALFVGYRAVQWGAMGLAFSLLIAYTASALPIMIICHLKGLMPRNTLFSRTAFAIWVVIGLLLLLVFTEINLITRVFVFVVAVVAICLAFLRLSKPVLS
ncbi:oligosaccharide flippase family protein [Thiocapsa bogorovii]|uniref:oligosaccharide flippase family protein n=1 Tax=Thiocapsa bogorovii TaxID=521689 RepID=UPI001E57515D|nr:oligosaccharide flippase family protein [Thiocapsa bogorovii]UHD16238.1 oligosaccharide flippase family protein [Thiocapsa bogorovii]